MKNDDAYPRGAVAYMARNGVAANLLMAFILAAGLASLPGLVQEMYPVPSSNHIEITVPYPGATPHEVEESIILKIEERVGTVNGVKDVTSVAAEGMASVMAVLETGADINRALNDIEAAVGSIQSFPGGAERPEVRERANRQSVIRLVLYGDVPERALKELAYRTEEQIASLPEVSYVETRGVRDYEISVEVPRNRLQALGLTLEDIAGAVRDGSLDLAAGSIETVGAEMRVRTTGQSYSEYDFEEIVVLSKGDGTLVRLGDLADVRDGFQDVHLITRYNGQPAAFVEVYRAAGEKVLDVADAVVHHLEREILPSLPTGVEVAIWNNDAEIYGEQVYVLVKNGFLGLLLVFVALTLFLNIRLALWVALGIAVAATGALAVMLVLDVSINAISMFAFVLAIGIMVDDAIVVAEHVHLERQKGASGVVAAIRGTQKIKKPLIFAVLTSVAAFSPLLFLPGGFGEVMGAFPIIVISVLLLSLVESLLVLPNHLSHLPGPEWTPSNSLDRFLAWTQKRVNDGFQWFLSGPLDRGLRLATGRPELVLASAVGVVILCVSLVPAGIIDVILSEPVEGDIVTANLEMPVGTPAWRTTEIAEELEAAGRRTIDRLSSGRPEKAEPLLSAVTLAVGMKTGLERGGGLVQEPNLKPGGDIGSVEFKLLGAQQRDISASTFLQHWREEVGAVPEARGLRFTAELLNLGLPVHIDLSHPDPERLGPIGDSAVERLRELQGVFDIQSDHSAGFQEIQIELRPEAQTLGLTLGELARQVRAAFFGTEALRLQRGPEDVRVYVRLPSDERDTAADVERYTVRTPTGFTVPLSRVATVRMEISPSSIRRKNGQRTVTVTADVDTNVTTGAEVTAILANTILPELAGANPGLTYAFGGEQQQQVESTDALGRGFVLALLVIFALLAIPLGSYTKPLIIMAVIPFGLIGAILGHLIIGIDLSIVSMMGILGLNGVVVNDSLVMVDFINRKLRDGVPARNAIIDGAKARFRPIFLTSATTFLAFTPLLLESAIQAQFLIPFAASIGFGIVFATGILMLVVPALTALHLRATTRRTRSTVVNSLRSVAEIRVAPRAVADD
ncbi:efflux RND transporter permease subunit [Candidatus Palauibacter polyketidifaciens]|uniref:efflux RND transporter permease subunit n=1 Tax=Candidatus Palauibacter polyketidifaciens TaxID=3056740 RepID=UPI0023A68E43|nr:efflux RND transporter permease subunit [Candidatus Palauibacter polyketidifaciens]MDE2721496.1 efflux RND transporter permease subunit [Candidatus Palauibacter polyketidifaciens]